MKFYLAPLEGITGHVFRNALDQHFHQMDKYFIPFIKPNQLGHFSAREKEDIVPEHNQGMRAVPQILTNQADDFIQTAGALREYGYTEVNLNLGCPSKTVINKKRGSGFLAFPDELEQFLEQIFAGIGSDMRISVKTRIGKECPEEFGRLLEIYNQYPFEEVIIHPRVQQDFYKNTPNWEVFGEALADSRNPVCYNGDIFTAADYEEFVRTFPQAETIMIGRGILKDPRLVNRLTGEQIPEKQVVKAFHDQIYQSYQEILFGPRPVLFKMKELWSYMAPLFTEYEKYYKRIKKAEQLLRYEETVEQLFEEQRFR